jgi:hypothetical protein
VVPDEIRKASVLSLYATQTRYPEAVVTLDSDGQHDPRDIEKVLAPLLNGADVVMSMTV